MTDFKTIAIDFDDTLTALPVLWRSFIRDAELAGHYVYIVTARRDTDENRMIVKEFMDEWKIKASVHFTNLGSKLHYMHKRGMKIDIWIDDNPHALVHGH